MTIETTYKIDNTNGVITTVHTSSGTTVAEIKIDDKIDGSAAIDICKALTEIFGLSSEFFNNPNPRAEDPGLSVDFHITSALMSDPPKCPVSRGFCNDCPHYIDNVDKEKRQPYCKNSGMFIAKFVEDRVKAINL